MNEEIETTADETTETVMPTETTQEPEVINEDMVDEAIQEETPMPETSDPVAEPYEGDNNNATDETTGTE